MRRSRLRPRGATRAQVEWVGPTGHVTGLDFDKTFPQIARLDTPPNAALIEDSATDTGLADGSSYLADIWFLSSTAGTSGHLGAKALRLLKPGGWITLQEAGGSSMKCFPPQPEWDRAVAPLGGLMPAVHSDYPTGRWHYAVLHGAGVTNLGYSPALVGVKGGYSLSGFVAQLRKAAASFLFGQGKLTGAELDRIIRRISACLARPDTIFIWPLLVQAWWSKPG